MQRTIAFFLVLCFGLVPVLWSGPSWAQDDWGVKRNPFDRKIITRYKRILERNPNDGTALRKLVQLYRKHRSVSLLVKEYEAQVDRNAKDFSGLVVLGHLHLREGERDEAMALYQRAATLRPESGEVQQALGDLHRQAGAVGEARAAYERALTSIKPSKKNLKTRKELLRALADLALDTGDVDGARAYYQRYFALDPKDVQARLALGDALVQHGKHDQAIEVFEKAQSLLRADPAGQVELIRRIGAAHEKAGREDAAVRAYRRAIGKVGRDYYLRKDLTERIVDIHRRRQALGDLIVEYEKDWPKNRRKHFEWDVLARLYEETGNQESAIEAFRQATKKAPYELDTQRRLIALLENSGRDDEALAQYEVVIRVAPGEPRFQLELAERYWRRGQEKEALALLSKMESRFPTDAGVHMAVAELYTRWGKADQALDAFKRLTRIDPGDIDHLINLGEQHFQRNQKKQAEAVWKKIIARKTPANYARLGEVYSEHDMQPEALEMYEKAIKLEPQNTQHYKGRARVYERKRAYAPAIADWEKVLSLTSTKKVDKPARREARRQIVNLMRRARGSMLRRRMRRWQQAFQKDPPDVDAGYFLVESYLSERKYEQARDVLQRLLAIDPEDTEAMEQLVKVYKREMQYDKAVALLVDLAEKLPSRQREFYNEIAEIKTDQRRDDEAIDWINKAVQSSPTDPVAHQRLAERYAEMQQFDKAIAAYEKTIELDRRNFRAHFTLAQLYKYVNQPNKAAELYRAVLRQATDEERLTRAGREAIALEEMTGTLGELERTLVPLAFTYGHKPVYRRVLVQLYDRYVPQLVARWEDGDQSAREELTRLGKHGLKPLLEALGDENDPIQQRIAVAVLGYLDNKGAAAPLVRVARKATEPQGVRRRTRGTLIPTIDWEVRVNALIAAGRLGDPRIIDDLVELSQHREKTMRQAALFALGRTGDAAAIPALKKALEENADERRTLACLGLAQIPSVVEKRAVMQSVERALADLQSPGHARGACAFALGHLGQKESVPVLLEALRQQSGEAQRLAAWALGRLGARRAVPALLEVYFTRDHEVGEMVRWALARAESGVPQKQAIEAIGLVGYPNGEVHYKANAAVENLVASPGAVELSPSIIVGHRDQLAAGLIASLSRHRDVVVDVLEVLDGSPDRLALGDLTEGPAAGLDKLPANQRTQVMRALEEIASALAPRLAELTAHRDPKVRALAFSTLAKTGAPAARDAAIRGLEDPIHSVRFAAMRAAARLAHTHPAHAKDLARAVAARLSADAWQVRSQAAEVLGAFGAHADRAALRRALGDESAYVRANAAKALGELADESDTASVDALVTASSDRDLAVARAALRSLAAIGGARARNALSEVAAGSGDQPLSELARELLGPGKN